MRKCWSMLSSVLQYIYGLKWLFRQWSWDNAAGRSSTFRAVVVFFCCLGRKVLTSILTMTSNSERAVDTGLLSSWPVLMVLLFWGTLVSQVSCPTLWMRRGCSPSFQRWRKLRLLRVSCSLATDICHLMRQAGVVCVGYGTTATW